MAKAFLLISLVSVLGICGDLTFFNGKLGSVGAGISENGLVAGYRYDLVVVGPDTFMYLDPLVWNSRTHKSTKIAHLDGYTNSDVHGISSTGLTVVGTATRLDSPHFHAFAWTSKGGTQGLKALPGETISHAAAATDRRTVGWSGSVTLKPCVWDLEESNGEQHWKVSALPIVNAASGQARAISSDGKYIGGDDGGVPVVWKKNFFKGWTRIPLFNEHAFVTGVNKSGEIVGNKQIRVKEKGDIYLAFRMRVGDKAPIYIQPIDPRHDGTEAMAINNSGVIVGSSFDALKAEVDAFLIRRGELSSVQVTEDARLVVTGSRAGRPLLSDQNFPIVLKGITDGNEILAEVGQPGVLGEKADTMQMFTSQLP